jgi:hypothetical protein
METYDRGAFASNFASASKQAIAGSATATHPAQTAMKIACVEAYTNMSNKMKDKK